MPITQRPIAVGPGLYAIDTDYVRPLLDASHLMVDAGRAAFVDTGTAHSVPQLLAALDELGIGRDAVDYVFVTHVHLDHAGGAGALMQHLPNARCVAHPRGARHLVDPAKLIAGTIAVYGEAAYRQLYGDLVPIPDDRMVVAEDTQRFRLGTRELELIHTPGHAMHHYAVVDLGVAGIFTGDTFGLSYREFDVDGRPFIFPTTTPVHFDPAAMHASIDRMLSYRPTDAYLTHYSRVSELPRLAADMHDRIDAFVAMAENTPRGPGRAIELEAGMTGLLERWLDDHGYRGSDERRHEWLHLDVKLNVQGLEVWLDRAA